MTAFATVYDLPLQLQLDLVEKLPLNLLAATLMAASKGSELHFSLIDRLTRDGIYFHSLKENFGEISIKQESLYTDLSYGSLTEFFRYLASGHVSYIPREISLSLDLNNKCDFETLRALVELVNKKGVSNKFNLNLSCKITPKIGFPKVEKLFKQIVSKIETGQDKIAYTVTDFSNSLTKFTIANKTPESTGKEPNKTPESTGKKLVHYYYPEPSTTVHLSEVSVNLKHIPSNVEILTLANCTIEKGGYPSFPKLKELTLKSCNGFENFLPKTFSTLETLNLKDCYINLKKANITQYKKLTSLSLLSVGLSKDIKYPVCLEKLSLSSSDTELFSNIPASIKVTKVS